MPTDAPLSRRTFTRLAAAGVLSPAALQGLVGGEPAPVPPPAQRKAAAHPATPLRAHASAALWPGYDAAIAIDLLATPGPFNVEGMFARPLTTEMVANAKSSGMTAVNVTVSGMGYGAAAFEQTVRALAFWSREIATHPGTFAPIRSVADIRAAKTERRLGIILGFQDATMYESDLSRVALFHELGVRVVQLTYNLRNLLGDGCLERANGGLSAFGRAVVAQLDATRTLVDLSHCGRQTTLDAIMASTRPVAVTHAGCSAVADVPRNKPDDILRRLADRGGVVGIYLMPFLRESGQPMAADFMRHLEHALRVCGEDHVGVGSDNSITPIALTPEFRAIHRESIMARRARGISAPGEDPEVFTFVPDINSPRRLEIIADLMAKAGHPSSRIEKVIGGNWLRLLGEVWG